jgi:GR25 family glycosyltransferase involved in LPS biosynthesis
MSLLERSMSAYVNLDSRPERRALMEKNLASTGLSAHRVRGMLPHEYKGDPAKIKAMLARPQKGAIGCHFSQVSIMRAADTMEKHAFVMEDDLVFCSDFQQRMVIIDEFCETHDWDVIWLGGTFHVGPPYWHKKDLGRDAEMTDNPRMIRTFGAFCTYAYIVNAKSIGKILSLFDQQLPNSIGIDYLFIQIQPQILSYAFVPGCIKQYDHQSDIGLGMTIFSNFSKLNGNLQNSAYWWQDKMTDFDPTKFDWKEARR